MLAIILGDVHLGKSQTLGKTTVGATLNSRLADQLNLLDWTLDQAVDCHADSIIITGDIFEEPKPHPSIITFFIAWLKKCQAYDVKVHLIVGNHDVFRSGFVYSSPLDIIAEAELENVSIYKDINTIFIGASAFTFMPFRDRKSFGASSNADAVNLLKNSLTYELASIPATYKKIVVGHLALEGSIPIGDEIDDISNELFCPKSMFEGYDYVWMGHVHKPQVLNKKNPHISHVGSMDISNFGETDHKKNIIIVDCLSANNDFTIKQLPTRSLKKISLVIPKDTEDTTQYVLNELKKEQQAFDKSIIKVDISLSDPELKSINKSQVEKYLIEQGVFNVAGISESKKVFLLKKDSENSIDTKMDVHSAVIAYSNTYIEDKNRDKFIDLALDIYNSYKSEVKE
jgi:exonuclease SbcD